MEKLILVDKSESPLEFASYNPETGNLNLKFSIDKILNTKEFFAGRHIDGVTFDGKTYSIELHPDDGPRDNNGRYIYNEDTIQTTFNINIGKGLGTDGGLNFGLSDHPDGRKQLFDFELTKPDTSENNPQPPEPVDLPSPVNPANPMPEPEPSDASFKVFLADSTTNEIIRELDSGEKISGKFLQNNDITLLVKSEDDDISSIFLDLEGVASRTESVEPYALYGDKNGDLNGSLKLSSGNYDLNLEGFSGDGGMGSKLAEMEFEFSVVNDYLVA